MHEVSVVANIVEAILHELENYNVERVEDVNIVIGDLTSLGFEQLEFAFEIVTKDTLLEGCKLNLIREKVEIRCKSCGYEGPADNVDSDFSNHSIPILACPKCNGPVEITAGESCCVKDLNIVEAESCSN